jgi:hypothetical protein
MKENEKSLHQLINTQEWQPKPSESTKNSSSIAMDESNC